MEWANENHINSMQMDWSGVYSFSLVCGNGEIVSAGRDTYAQVAHWMQIFSIGWIIVFIVTLFSKLWNKNENLSSKALVSSLLYFVVAYLIH